MNRKTKGCLGLAFLLPFLFSIGGEAGNLKKRYLNLTKAGEPAQAGDFPPNYPTVVQTLNETLLHDQTSGNYAFVMNGAKRSRGQLKFGNALDLNGNDQYATFPVLKSVSPTLGDFTVEAWVFLRKHNETYAYKRSYILDFRGDGSTTQDSFGMIIDAPNGQAQIHPYIAYSSGGWSELNNPIADPLNRWVHLAFSREGNQIKAWVNGVRVVNSWHQNTYGVKTDPINLMNKGRLGDYSKSSPLSEYAWNGMIDDVRLWNVSRSDAEIQANMNRELRGDEKGLIGYWTFN